LNVQEYISSGIIESCVLGLASPDEWLEFERNCEAYAEIRAARESFEKAVEQQAMESAQLPPSRLKGKIFAEIDIEKEQLRMEAATRPPKLPVVQIMPIWSRYVAAAAVLLLVFSTLLNFYFFTKYKEYIAKYDDLITTQKQSALLNQAMQNKLQDYESALKLIRDPGMMIVKMPHATPGPSPSSMATIYWDTKSKDVYLMVNNLPMPASDKQYQLWAIVNGKPVDAGVFVMDPGSPIVKMKNITQAQAFAITLEKKGGSSTPTMEAMYVMGKVIG
jgi:anti-sigma-K factor RskA